MPPLSSFRPALRAAHTRRAPGRRCCPSPTSRCRPTSSTARVYVDGERLPGRCTHDRRADRGPPRAARASSGSACTSRPRSRSPASRTSSGSTSSPSRTPCTPTSGPSSSATTTRCSWCSRPSATAPESRVDASEVVETGEVMVFLGRDFVITVRHGDHSRPARRAPARWRPTPSSSRWARPPCCTRSRTTSSTAIWPSPRRSRTTSTSWSARSSTPPLRAGRRADLRDEARGARAAAGGGAAGGPLRKLTEGYSSLVPHEVRSYFRDVDDHLVHRRRAHRLVRRAAHHARRRGPGQDHDAAERRHAQDHRLGGDPVGARPRWPGSTA